MNSREIMTVIARHLVGNGWSHWTSVHDGGPADGRTYTSTFGTYVKDGSPHHIHLSPIGEIQVNERTAGIGFRRLLILACDDAVKPIVILRTLGVLDPTEREIQDAYSIMDATVEAAIIMAEIDQDGSSEPVAPEDTSGEDESASEAHSGLAGGERDDGTS